MMIERVDLSLIGGGLASETTAETLRKEGAGGKIIIIFAENFSPYHGPPLSKHSGERVLRKMFAK